MWRRWRRWEPWELYALRPDRMRIVPGPDGWPEAYDYRSARRTSGSRKRVPRSHRSCISRCSIRPTIIMACRRWKRPLRARYPQRGRGLEQGPARQFGAAFGRARVGGSLTEAQFDRLEAELEPNYRAAPMRVGRCFWKAGSTGSPCPCRRKIWISSKPKPPPPGRSRSPSRCHRCCSIARQQHACQLRGSQPGLLPPDLIPLVSRTTEALVQWLQPARRQADVFIRISTPSRPLSTSAKASGDGYRRRVS